LPGPAHVLVSFRWREHIPLIACGGELGAGAGGLRFTNCQVPVAQLVVYVDVTAKE
jgi:hypothetical protein